MSSSENRAKAAIDACSILPACAQACASASRRFLSRPSRCGDGEPAAQSVRATCSASPGLPRTRNGHPIPPVPQTLEAASRSGRRVEHAGLSLAVAGAPAAVVRRKTRQDGGALHLRLRAQRAIAIRIARAARAGAVAFALGAVAEAGVALAAIGVVSAAAPPIAASNAVRSQSTLVRVRWRTPKQKRCSPGMGQVVPDTLHRVMRENPATLYAAIEQGFAAPLPVFVRARSLAACSRAASQSAIRERVRKCCRRAPFYPARRKGTHRHGAGARAWTPNCADDIVRVC
jgi:hypothetical protein